MTDSREWEAKILAAPGAKERVREIEDELRLAAGLTDIPAHGEVDWTLINDLHTKPHPLINHDPERFPEHARCDSIGCGEIVMEARTVHHLLDLAGIPRGHGYSSDVDARTYLLLVEVIDLRERLGRIAGWHARETADLGMVGDWCVDCGHTWPCNTHQMAEGTYEDES